MSGVVETGDVVDALPAESPIGGVGSVFDFGSAAIPRIGSPMIEAEGLGHRFARSPFLWRNVSFSVHSGEIVAVCGRSGAGKSTLLSIVAGWENPTEGIVRRHGSRVHWVFQNPYGAAYRTALDIAAYPLLAAGFSRADADRQAAETLAMFDLADRADSMFMSLSGGEAQRLMLARAINARPQILLVDEPTAQLDTHTAKLVNATLSRLSVSGAAVMVATHDAQTRDACDRVIDLDRYGRMV